MAFGHLRISSVQVHALGDIECLSRGSHALAMILSLAKEFGWQKASAITVFEVTFAIFLSGIAYRLLSLFV